MLDFEIPAHDEKRMTTTKVVVVGVGGAGSNIINSLINCARPDYSCITINTDIQSLDQSRADKKIAIGTHLTKGRGAGADPEVGKAAAEESLAEMLEAIHDADCVILTGGLGGGTGSGVLPVIAHALHELDIVTIALVTKPFGFEGKRRLLIADQAELLLKNSVDTLITLSNQRLIEMNAQRALSFLDACSVIHGIIGDYIKGIIQIISKPGLINVDFADLKTVLKGQGSALMGIARAQGEERALKAAHNALVSPFTQGLSLQGARSILLQISGNHTLGLHEIQQAASRITEDCDEHATIIIGSTIDETLHDEVEVIVIATGFKPEPIAGHKQQYDHRTVHTSHHHETTSRPSASYNSSEHHNTLFKEHPLRDVLPSLEKRIKESQYSSAEELDVPAYLRKLKQERARSES